MKLVIQRSKEANVKIEDKTFASIPYGFVILVGFTNGDTEKDIDELIDKVIHLRVFDDHTGTPNLSILDVKGSILSISQFTLYANTEKGRRPSYQEAMKKEEAIKLYQLWNQKLSSFAPVKTGQFGAMMQVTLTNDGPITIILESRESHVKK